MPVWGWSLPSNIQETLAAGHSFKLRNIDRSLLTPYQVPAPAGQREGAGGTDPTTAPGCHRFNHQREGSHVTRHRRRHQGGHQGQNGPCHPHARATVADPTASGRQGVGGMWFSGFRRKQPGEEGGQQHAAPGEHARGLVLIPLMVAQTENSPTLSEKAQDLIILNILKLRSRERPGFQSHRGGWFFPLQPISV